MTSNEFNYYINKEFMNFRLDRYLQIQEQVDIKIDDLLSQIQDIYTYFDVQLPFQRAKVQKVLHEILNPLKQSEILAQEYAQMCLKNKKVEESPFQNKKLFQENEESEQCEKQNDLMIQQDLETQKKIALDSERQKNESKNSWNADYQDQRKKAIEHAKSEGTRDAAVKYNVPNYLIDTWMKGRKKGVYIKGRKPNDNDMENQLCEWLGNILEKGQYVTQKQIRSKALQLTSSQSFKASKGWLQKFFRRNPEIFFEYTRRKK